MSIYPAIIPIPNYVHVYHRKYKILLLRWFARKAVKRSSKNSGLILRQLCKDPYGKPEQSGGIYWSITHKTEFVGGLAAPIPIGIDIEKILPRTKKLYGKIATLYEWNLYKEENNIDLFFRYWTAKEAVLKAELVGLIGLHHCRIEKVIDKVRMLVRYGKRIWCVEHLYFKEHVAAVAADSFDVNWSVQGIDVI